MPSISAIDITEARAKQVSFSNAYYDSSASYVALKGKADLASAKTVGVQNGTTIPTIYCSRKQTI